MENEARFLKWLPAHSLLSYQRPIELREGILREGTFKYVTHNNYNYGEEIFFHPNDVQDNNYNDYLRKIVSYFVKKDNLPSSYSLPVRILADGPDVRQPNAPAGEDDNW